MLRLRWQALRFNVSRLIIISCTASIALHIAMVILLFVPPKNTNTMQLVLGSRRISDLPIQFVSTAHHIPGAMKRVAQLQNQAQKNVSEKKLPVAAAPEPCTTINKMKPEKKQIAQKKQQKQSLKTASKEKKVESKKEKMIAAAKKLPEKIIDKKQELKPEPIKKLPEKKEEQEKQPNEIKKMVTEHQEIQQQPLLSQNDVQSMPVDNEIIAIGHQEYDALCLYAVIQEEIERAWHPPAGIRPPRGCVVKVSVDNDGKVSHAVIQESSTLITYDIAARMALLQTYLPRDLAGKELIIAFQL
ncbi:TonB C-terminal domain-containing protein [Candidatus Dependentiae bacterium]|nr:TonB C-terminal domain-containing protein [Candidatus Dependentiae bacterium]